MLNWTLGPTWQLERHLTVQLRGQRNRPNIRNTPRNCLSLSVCPPWTKKKLKRTHFWLHLKKKKKKKLYFSKSNEKRERFPLFTCERALAGTIKKGRVTAESVQTVNPLGFHQGELAGRRRWCAIVVQNHSTALSFTSTETTGLY